MPTAIPEAEERGLELVAETNPEVTGDYPTTVPQNSLIVEPKKDPELVIAEATKAAKALQGIVKQAGLSFKLGGTREHLGFEAWQTIGAFNQATARVVNTRRMSKGEVFYGYEAKAEVVKNGQVISAAEAMCTIDEKNWGMRAKYANGQKIGEVATPEFQLRSMAQTRAAAKALRMAFAWVAVLAGYDPTPREEILEDEKMMTADDFVKTLPKPNVTNNAPVKTDGGKLCAVCSQPMSLVPAGTSKTTGKPYPAFYACKVRTHKQPR